MKIVVKNLDCPNITESKYLKSMRRIVGKANLTNLEDAEYLSLEYIGGNLYINENIYEELINKKIEIKGKIVTEAKNNNKTKR